MPKFYFLLAAMLFLGGCLEQSMLFDPTPGVAKREKRGFKSGNPTRDAAMVVIQKHCSGCHNGYHKLSDAEFQRIGWVIAGNPVQSMLCSRMKFGSKWCKSVEDMPKVKETNFVQGDAESLILWIVTMRQDKNSSSSSGGPAAIAQKPRLGDRHLMASVLEQAFAGAGKTEIMSLVGSRATIFGGPCDPRGQADLGCKNSDSQDSGLASHQRSDTTVSAGQRIKACDVLSLKYGEQALLKATGRDYASWDKTPMPSDQDLGNIHNVFYPGQSPTAAMLSTLRNLAKDAISAGEKNIGPATAVLLMVCYTPWELL